MFLLFILFLLVVFIFWLEDFRLCLPPNIFSFSLFNLHISESCLTPIPWWFPLKKKKSSPMTKTYYQKIAWTILITTSTKYNLFMLYLFIISFIVVINIIVNFSFMSLYIFYYIWSKLCYKTLMEILIEMSHPHRKFVRDVTSLEKFRKTELVTLWSKSILYSIILWS